MSLLSSRAQYRYQSYWCHMPSALTICVNAIGCNFSPQIRVELGEVPGIFCRSDRRSRYVSTAGRPSGQREGHYPRAVGTGDEGPEGDALSPGLRLGETRLPLG